MTETEYKNELQKIEQSYQLSKRSLMMEYSKSKRLFNIGDIITNDIYTIKIEKFGVYLNSLPEPTYIGIELKKDLTPKKKGDIQTIFSITNVRLIKKSENT